MLDIASLDGIKVIKLSESAVPKFKIIQHNYKKNKIKLINKEIIPNNILNAMKIGWDENNNNLNDICVYIVDNVYITNEGLIFNSNKELIYETITQHSINDIYNGLNSLNCNNINYINGINILARKRGERNYGHFLIEILPKIYLCDFFINNYDGIIIPDVNDKMNAVIMDSLKMLNIRNKKIIPIKNNKTVMCEQLIIVDGISIHGTYMHPFVMNAINKIKIDINGKHDKVFIIRNNERTISNMNEVCSFLKEHGFYIVDPLKMNLYEQIEAVKQANTIVGIMGAELTNMVWANSGTKVICLAPSVMPDTFFYLLAQANNQDYIEIRCMIDDIEQGRKSNFTVDTSILNNII